MYVSTSHPLETRSVELPTGVRLDYVEQGSPDGVPVLLLHGITDSLHSYDLMLPELPRSIRAFAISQRGHGDSDKPAGGYLPSDFAADVAAFLDASGIQKAAIVGHSMGSSVARRFAAELPQRTLGLVLLGSLASFADKPDMVQVAREFAALTDPIDPQVAIEFQESTVAQPIAQAFMDLAVNESLKAPAHVWRQAWNGLMSTDHPTIAQLERIQAPTLMLWGDQDTFALRADQDTLLGAIRGSKLVVYEGVGHALHWEQPARAAADLVAFVEKLG